MDDRGYGILVGYDALPQSRRALAWAAKEASLRGIGLTVCQVWRTGLPAGSEDAAATETAQHRGELLLDQGIAYARSLFPHNDVHALLADGPVAEALCGHSERVEMMVVGSCDLGGIAELLPGWVASLVAAQAHAPVVVVRGPRHQVGHTPQTVLVGIDGSPESEAALAFAFEEAHLHHAPLTALAGLTGEDLSPAKAARLATGVDRLLAPWQCKYPEVQAQLLAVREPAREALVTAASEALLVVVGAHGYHRIGHDMLGSVSQAVLSHAPCPVAIVHDGLEVHPTTGL